MSTTTETVTVDREAMLDAVAGLQAASEVLSSLNGASDCELADYFEERSRALRAAAFGPCDEDSDAVLSHPIVVEVGARADEMAADALTWLHMPSQLERALDDFQLAEIAMRTASLQKHAEKVRAAGTINVRFDV